AAYHREGPEHLKCVGETEFIANAARLAKEQGSPAQIAGLVARADLRDEKLDSTLEAHEAAAEGLFRGIRQAGACSEGIEGLVIPGGAEAHLFEQEEFRRGLEHLGALGLTYDTWLYHFQLPEFIELARAVPETTMILDHFGTPLGVGPFAGQREAIFEKWQSDIADLAECPNVFMKIGGLAMPDNGFGWYGREMPPTSDEFVDAQSPYYAHTIACFGPERCMFESNFPVDRLSVGYRVLWNAFKKMTSHFSDDDKNLMFSGVARKVYRLETP
ncbi:MAG: amidohydrolase family protein, partial [Halieaceae bacterium]